MSSAAAKLELRRRMRLLRDAISLAQRLAASEVVRQRVLASPGVAGARSVFCYVSFRSEVATHGLIADLLAAGKMVCVPRITTPGVMTAERILSLDDLQPGPYGIPTPRASATAAAVNRIDVAIVPGLAFSHAGDRLGYGAGHYDRWFAQHAMTQAVGLCFRAQLLEHIPTDAHDHPMDQVITE